MTNPNREIDKTHLSIDTAEERGLIHRDYIAHCLRWSHVVKRLHERQQYKTAHILDIGCGKETPLIKTLYVNRMTPHIYHGVDINRLEITDMHEKIAAKGCGLELFGGYDVGSFFQTNPTYSYSMIVCFEVLEHVHPKFVLPILRDIHDHLHDDGVAFISTPVFNGKAAANHINEMTYEAMEYLLYKADLGIVHEYGTFASQRDLEPAFMKTYVEDAFEVYDELKEYYDSNILSVIFAPLFPKSSRNVLWEVKRGYPRIVKQPDEVMSSSPDWEILKQKEV